MAAELPSRFELPKQFAKRGTDTTYTRSVKDMVIDVTPKFEAWFETTNKELSPACSGGKIKVTAEAVELSTRHFLSGCRRQLQELDQGQYPFGIVISVLAD